MSQINRITCDEAGMLVSRSLDGDLAKAEVVDLYQHLSACDDCRAKAAEMAALESMAGELAKFDKNGRGDDERGNVYFTKLR